ncbi:hypothetical protein [Taibaiella koreensis]|uniref:hypothetical protein n=1 Tax=Taibaiella koreensis TaxID=1268548 RepID=UPI000E59CB75|nr:hypothetical protein [Taibaiella koreensis]
MKPFLTAATAVLLMLASFCGNAQGFGNTPVTKGTSPKFIWTNWTKAPQSLKDATKLIITRRGSTLYDFIQSVLTEEDVAYPEVDIALIDLNGDGVLGIGIQLRSRSWCGTAGCAYEMYDNAGIIYVIVSDTDLKPAVNGVESSAKKYFVMEANKKCQYHGINDTPAIFITKKI